MKSDEELEDILDEVSSMGDEADAARAKRKALKLKKKKRLRGLDGERLRPDKIDAGHGRDEASRKVKDELEEEAELRADADETFRADADAFEIDTEIAAGASGLEVDGAQEHRHYFWARFKSDSGASQADAKLALRVRVREKATGKSWMEPVWYVLNERKDPEARDLMNSGDGTRRLGDVILLWSKREVHEAVVAAARAKAIEWMSAPSKAAHAFEARTGIKIVNEADMAREIAGGRQAFEKATKHAEAHRGRNLAADQAVRERIQEAAQ